MTGFHDHLRQALREHVEERAETALERNPVTEAEYRAMEEAFGLAPADPGSAKTALEIPVVRVANGVRNWIRALIVGATAMGAFWLGTFFPRERGGTEFAAATMRGPADAPATPGSPDSASILRQNWNLSLDLDAGRFAIRFTDGSNVTGPLETQPAEAGEFRIGVRGTGRTRDGKALKLTGGEIVFRFSATDGNPQRSSILILSVGDEQPIEQVYGASVR